MSSIKRSRGEETEEKGDTRSTKARKIKETEGVIADDEVVDYDVDLDEKRRCLRPGTLSQRIKTRKRRMGDYTNPTAEEEERIAKGLCSGHKNWRDPITGLLHRIEARPLLRDRRWWEPVEGHMTSHPRTYSYSWYESMTNREVSHQEAANVFPGWSGHINWMYEGRVYSIIKNWHSRSEFRMDNKLHREGDLPALSCVYPETLELYDRTRHMDPTGQEIQMKFAHHLTTLNQFRQEYDIRRIMRLHVDLQWYTEGHEHREGDGPSIINGTITNGRITTYKEHWNLHGKRHRETPCKPTWVSLSHNSFAAHYYRNDVPHSMRGEYTPVYPRPTYFERATGQEVPHPKEYCLYGVEVSVRRLHYIRRAATRFIRYPMRKQIERAMCLCTPIPVSVIHHHVMPFIQW